MHFVKCEGKRKNGDRDDKQNGERKRNERVTNEREPCAAGKIRELLERQRSEDLILYLYELWDFKLHD